MSGSGHLLPKFTPSRFSGVYHVFEVFRDTWQSKKEIPSARWHATLSCLLMASIYINSHLVLISFGGGIPWTCNLCGHLQRCQMPDIETAEKTAEKGAEWVTVKQPKNSRKNSRNTQKTTVLANFLGAYLVLQACISFCSVSHKKWRTSVFALFA